MTLIKYRHRRPSFFQPTDMSRIFDQFFAHPTSTDEERNWLPAFDVRETNENLIFASALPGIDKKEINVTLHDGVLTVTAERVRPEIDDDTKLHTAEMRYGKFSRSFSIGHEVDEDQVNAKYDNGILTVRLKKVETEQSVGKQITVK